MKNILNLSLLILLPPSVVANYLWAKVQNKTTPPREANAAMASIVFELPNVYFRHWICILRNFKLKKFNRKKMNEWRCFSLTGFSWAKSRSDVLRLDSCMVQIEYFTFVFNVDCFTCVQKTDRVRWFSYSIHVRVALEVRHSSARENRQY